MKLFLANEIQNFFSNAWTNIVAWLQTTGVKVVVGVILLFITFKIINAITNGIQKRLQKKQVDKTVEVVVVGAVRKFVKFLAVAIFLGYLGFETSSLAALVAALGVGVGFALQGSLSNLAGGLILVIMRPFKIGDYIESNGQGGTVEIIKVFYTYLVTPDNRVVMIPNGNVANGTIINYSGKDTRRIDLTFSISYESDFAKAKQLILECVDNMGLSLQTPEPFVNIVSHGANSIDIVTRVWAKSSDYWTVYFKLLEDVKVAFDKNGIEIPYQQLDVHVKNK